MPSNRIRLLAVGAVLAVVAVVVLTQRGNSARTPPRRLPGPVPKCLELPDRAALPTWLPKDLTLPPGSYASSQTLPDQGTNRRAIFAVNAPLTEFLTFVRGRWPETGWVLASTDVEPGESESTFVKREGGLRLAFTALSSFCDDGWTWLYLVLGSTG